MKLTLDDFRTLALGALEYLEDTDAVSLEEWQRMLARRIHDCAHDAVPGLEDPDDEHVDSWDEPCVYIAGDE